MYYSDSKQIKSNYILQHLNLFLDQYPNENIIINLTGVSFSHYTSYGMVQNCYEDVIKKISHEKHIVIFYGKNHKIDDKYIKSLMNFGSQTGRYKEKKKEEKLELNYKDIKIDINNIANIQYKIMELKENGKYDEINSWWIYSNKNKLLLKIMIEESYLHQNILLKIDNILSCILDMNINEISNMYCYYFCNYSARYKDINQQENISLNDFVIKYISCLNKYHENSNELKLDNNVLSKIQNKIINVFWHLFNNNRIVNILYLILSEDIENVIKKDIELY